MLADEILSKLEIHPLHELKIHEQVVQPNLIALRETMLNLGRLVDPLIIDREHKIVLDGNHRRMVLEMLKTDHAICQVVDYMDPRIQMGGWHIATPALKFSDIRAEPVDYATGKAALTDLSASFMAVGLVDGKKMCKLIESPEPKLSAVFAHQEQYLKQALGTDTLVEKQNNGHSVYFVEDNRSDLFLEKGYTLFERKIFTKQEVIAEAVAGRPLPPKSTRHMIPDRIIRLNFRLGYLNEDRASATAHLRQMIQKRVKFGSARYYTEPVIVLY